MIETYTGEHLLPGLIGRFFVSLTFVASLIAFYTYLRASKATGEEQDKWKKWGRCTFLIAAASSFIFIGTMFYLLVVQYFEYDYVWEQSNTKMSFEYILVCFWGGQQGSFMLWIFWHSVIGLFLLRFAKGWENEVLAVFALLLAFISSMLLGIYIGDYRVGTSPFALQRETIDGLSALWSLIPDYLLLDPRFADGRGLNPLLQNYWMIIHPPTLFLGFALTIVPFAYAAAALWRRSYSEWIKPALPWTFAGILVLGIGILMGGAWAYESLSFGGFWAWDPVENASLVPWITLVGAGHLMLVNRNQSRSLYSTFFLTLISFILILYSTFLTRSGVLGDTSVHSFTGDGMLGQLLFCLLFFIWASFTLLLVDKKAQIKYTVISLALVLFGIFIDLNTVLYSSGDFVLTWRGLIILVAFTYTIIFLINNYLLHFPREKKEEELWSREFWMFIGSLVLVLSAVQITFSTSIPVINLLFDTKMNLVEQAARNEAFNRWQAPFAVIICLLIAFGQFLKYKNTSFTEFGKKILPSLVIAIVLTIALGTILQLTHYRYNLLLFTALWSVVANADYWLRFLKGKMNIAGSSIAHIGFGILMLGALISQNKQTIISETPYGYNLSMLGKDLSNLTDVQIFKGDTTEMREYFVHYSGTSQEKHFLRFNIDYFSKVPAQFQKGEHMKFDGNVYRCLNDHTSSGQLTSDISNWELLTDPGAELYFAAQPWSAWQAGEKLFHLQPFVQLNDMSNVAEPGTKHYFDHDIFTHIKYADLRLVKEDDNMPPYEITTHENDTIGNPGFILRVAGIRSLNGEEKAQRGLDTSLSAAQLNMVVYDIWDISFRYGKEVNPVFFIEENEFRSLPARSEELKTSFAIKSVKPKKDEHSHTGFEHGGTEITLEITTPEFIIMHAIRFPWISILWIGCLIMAIGTGMAVVYRVRK
ncbi:MAG TPA: cytochrome c biogenesis protein CcsA [Flavobacteriales bacterium]|nr:cytochrome c biogenesis protein CcsA [Flavobacteriales bacterium]HRJ37820.1 cytochrome c biogenesis protein CcsA [Flavobacteriales bacterium]